MGKTFEVKGVFECPRTPGPFETQPEATECGNLCSPKSFNQQKLSSESLRPRQEYAGRMAQLNFKQGLAGCALLYCSTQWALLLSNVHLIYSQH